MSFMTYGVNIIFGAISMTAVTAYGIFYKIQQFVFFADFGLRDAITPIVSFNYGRGNQKRVKEGVKYGVIYITTIMISGAWMRTQLPAHIPAASACHCVAVGMDFKSALKCSRCHVVGVPDSGIDRLHCGHSLTISCQSFHHSKMEERL